ncbi:MAG: sigma-70 family RNA polymerase sigma factor [Anaerolineae bacterium]|nr:sigma-70 family RNA polymerase sigma factor [Anaerolineae bacterium]
MIQSDENALIAQAKVDPEAFSTLYQRYVNRIYNYHYRHTSHQVEAEDLTSRTFYRALRSLHRYRETGASFQAWLFRIAHNLVANWYRDQARKQTVTIDDDNPPLLYSKWKGPEESTVDTEAYQALVSVIASLPEDRKTLIILKFVENMTNAEIAGVLGKTEGAVKALYHRTLISLRKIVPEGVWYENEIQS